MGTWVSQFHLSIHPLTMSFSDRRSRRDGGEGRGVEGKYILYEVIEAEILFCSKYSGSQLKMTWQKIFTLTLI